jgi:periplasmic copper chaperone A
MRTPKLTQLVLGLLCLSLPALTAVAGPAGDSLVFVDPWVRETLPGRDVTAAYVVIRNDNHQADKLLSVGSEVATTVELHKMVHQAETMKMERVPTIDVPANGTVELKPGGLHLMLFGLKRPLVAGETLRLTLRFERAGEKSVEATVRAPEGKKHG